MIRCLGLKRKTIALYKYTETLTFTEEMIEVK